VRHHTSPSPPSFYSSPPPSPEFLCPLGSSHHSLHLHHSILDLLEEDWPYVNQSPLPVVVAAAVMQRPAPHPLPFPSLPKVPWYPLVVMVPAAANSDACGSRFSAPQPTSAQIPSGVRPLEIRLQDRWVQGRPGEMRLCKQPLNANSL
jgi:hypothetical protein